MEEDTFDEDGCPRSLAWNTSALSSNHGANISTVPQPTDSERQFLSAQLLQDGAAEHVEEQITRKRKRNKQTRRGARSPSPSSKPDLLVFGYSCKLFRDNATAERVERGEFLMPWRDAYDLTLDQYDVRHLLDNQDHFVNHPSVGLSIGELLPEDVDLDNLEAICDEMRYEDVDSEEELIFDMDSEAREAYIASKRKKRQAVEENKACGIPFNYGTESAITASNSVSEETIYKHDEEPFIPSFDIPEEILRPSTRKQHLLVLRTARYMEEKTADMPADITDEFHVKNTMLPSDPQLEIVIRTKQAGNPLFLFLDQMDALHTYYRYIRWLLRAKRKSYEDLESQGVEKDESKTSDDTNSIGQPASLDPLEAFPKPPHAMLQIMKKLCKLIVQNGDLFEEKVRKSNEASRPAMAFLQADNVFHITFQAMKCIEKGEPVPALPSSSSSLSSSSSSSVTSAAGTPVTESFHSTSSSVLAGASDSSASSSLPTSVNTDEEDAKKQERLERVRAFLLKKKTNEPSGANVPKRVRDHDVNEDCSIGSSETDKKIKIS